MLLRSFNEQKIFFRFSKSGPTLRFTILDSRDRLCNVIKEGRPPLRNTNWEAGALPSDLRIENDSQFFYVFLETTFVHVSCCHDQIDHTEPKILCPNLVREILIIFFRSCPPMSQNRRPLSYRIQKGQDIGGHVTPFLYKIYRSN